MDETEDDNNVVNLFGGEVIHPLRVDGDLKLDTEDILEAAKQFEFEHVMVVGYNANDCYIATSTSNIKEILFLQHLLEQMIKGE